MKFQLGQAGDLATATITAKPSGNTLAVGTDVPHNDLASASFSASMNSSRTADLPDTPKNLAQHLITNTNTAINGVTKTQGQAGLVSYTGYGASVDALPVEINGKNYTQLTWDMTPRNYERVEQALDDKNVDRGEPIFFQRDSNPHGQATDKGSVLLPIVGQEIVNALSPDTLKPANESDAYGIALYFYLRTLHEDLNLPEGGKIFVCPGSKLGSAFVNTFGINNAELSLAKGPASWAEHQNQ